MEDLELVPITEYADIVVDLRYSSANNILHKIIASQTKPFASTIVAGALGDVVDQLKSKELQLVIWDAYRTVDTQESLKKLVNDVRYVSNRSNHLKGLAVDVTLADKNGKYLDMGTDFDDFTDKAHSDNKDISSEQLQNRKSLKRAMEAAGFRQWKYEWWHFDFISKMENI